MSCVLTHGREIFGNTPSYAKLAKPHEQVHSSTHHMVDLLRLDWERDQAAQSQIYGAMETTEMASQQVMDLLDRLVAEKHGKQGG